MLGQTILVIDDDVTVCRSVELAFVKAGAKVITALDGREGLQQFFQHRPDLVILDIMMPGVDGWETCRQIRALATTPIIILSTISQESAIIRGLDYGADDFVLKPFSAGILLARARASLRRVDAVKSVNKKALYRDEYLEIDLTKKQVSVNGAPVRLTATEYRLLKYLIQNAGQMLTYEQILQHVWGWEYRDNIDYVHVYVSYLRRKLEKNPKEPQYLLTEHGLGYRLVKISVN